jgi:predicted transcriptional regulator
MDKRITDIALKIKKLRLEKGYTSYENFAWDNQIPRVQYWRMEKGTNFTIRTFLRILDVHNMTLKQFFDDIDSPKNQNTN